jgi:hypothetical protein
MRIESSESALAKMTARGGGKTRMLSLRSIGLMLLVIASTVVLVAAPGHAQSALITSFNHFLTGFPLVGTHAGVPCANCHVNGRFENTPQLCIGCHNTMTAPGEPQSHPKTTTRCGSCHLTTTWRDFRFMDHTQATGSCASCHNNKLALGKSNDHIATVAACETCHHNTVTFAGATVPATPSASNPVPSPGTATAPSTTSAATTPTAGPAKVTTPPIGTNAVTAPPAGASASSMPPFATTEPGAAAGVTTGTAVAGAHVNHGGITGACASCHNGATALGKPAAHIPTGAPCESCHKSAVTFAGARTDHSRVIGSCISCHNGRAAIGKPTQHITTNAACGTCHKSSVTFAGARVDHASIAAPCASCHNGTTTEGKPPRHFLTALPCETCHRVATWTLVSYRHASTAYVNHGPGMSCTNCHLSNAQTVGWKFPAFRPDCAGCHVDKYRPMSHLKFERPVKVYYTIAELRDCKGACHVFADNTQRVILTRRFGLHQAMGGGW